MDAKRLYRVVFSVDDILWPFMSTMAKTAGVCPQDWTDHDVDENASLTVEQRERLKLAIINPASYGGMDFYSVLKTAPREAETCLISPWTMKRFRELGIELTLLDSTPNQEIAEMKRKQIAKRFSDIPGTHSLDTSDDESAEKFSREVFLAASSNPYDIAASKARYHVMPVLPWNQTPKALQQIGDRWVIFTRPGEIGMMISLAVWLAENDKGDGLLSIEDVKRAMRKMGRNVC